MIETTSTPSYNRRALTGFIVSMLALISFCAGFVPIPFTAIICYPISILLGVIAFVVGLSSIRQIRSNGENGKVFALISVWAGGFVIFMTICFITLGILLWPYVFDFIKQAWHQLNLNPS
jgi:hypothetical protein